MPQPVQKPIWEDQYPSAHQNEIETPCIYVAAFADGTVFIDDCSQLLQYPIHLTRETALALAADLLKAFR